MRRFFCDCCGCEITDHANRYTICLIDKKSKKSKAVLHLCATDAKKVRQMKLVPMQNVRVRRFPKLYNVVEKHADRQKALYILPEWNVDQLKSLKRTDRTKLRTADGLIYYTKEYVLSRVDGSFKPEEARKKLIEWTQLLFNYQTEDEKKSYETKHHNNRGFNKPDAKFMSAMARVAFTQGYECLSEKQWQVIYKRFVKYAEQVANILNESQESEFKD